MNSSLALAERIILDLAERNPLLKIWRAHSDVLSILSPISEKE
jgi:hypothetical protein